jgi:hypothetical protein
MREQYIRNNGNGDYIYYIDNYLTEEKKHDLIEGLKTIRWVYQVDAAYPMEEHNPQDKIEAYNLNGYFSHEIFHAKYLEKSDVPFYILPLLDGLNHNYLARIKCNLYVRTGEESAEHHWHLDYGQGYHPAMVWCADSADTGIEFHNPNGKSDYVHSKTNRAIFFNSAIFHRTKCPIKAKERVTININYIPGEPHPY